MTEENPLRQGVREAYSAAATGPDGEHPFPVGPEFAESVGYPAEALARYPQAAAAFAGVSNVAVVADIPAGATVLDLGCGAGLDSLIAAEKAGPEGHVIGIDFSTDMIARARQTATEAGVHNTTFHQASAESLPVEDATVDVALVNGIFNLNPHRDDIFHQLARVVRPGGVVYGAELVLREELPSQVVNDEASWFA